MTKFTDFLYDLIQNSIHAKSSVIILNITYVDDILYVHLKDDGIGMTKEVLEDVRNFNYTSNQKRSVGLGLSMIYDLTKQTEGHFEINSKHKKGTDLYLSFKFKHIDFPDFGNLSMLISDLYMHQDLLGFKLIYKKHHNTLTYTLSSCLLRDKRSFKIKKFIEENINESLEKVEGYL